ERVRRHHLLGAALRQAGPGPGRPGLSPAGYRAAGRGLLRLWPADHPGPDRRPRHPCLHPGPRGRQLRADQPQHPDPGADRRVRREHVEPAPLAAPHAGLRRRPARGQDPSARQGLQHALGGQHGRRRAPDHDPRRDLQLSARCQERGHGRQTAADVRGQPDGLPGRAGRRRGDHRTPAHARSRAFGPAPAGAGVPGLEGRGRRGRALPRRVRRRRLILSPGWPLPGTRAVVRQAYPGPLRRSGAAIGPATRRDGHSDRFGGGMAAVSAGPGQCVVWFGDPLPHERKALAAAGWQLRAVAPGHGTGRIGLRAGDTVVGMLDLRDADAAAADRAAQLAEEYRHLPFLAIIPRRLADAPGLRVLLEQCRRHFTRAPEPDKLVAAVTALATSPVPDSPTGLDALVGQSPAMLETIATIRKFAPIDLPTLVTGETGTGKEVAARALHDLSRRAGKVFAPLNCGSIPDNLVQSELFGHERGAFTGATARRTGLFEAADGGTVFLDEIGDLPLDAQTNLLRVLQEGTIERVGSHQPIAVDVRVIAATHVDLE